MSGRETRNGEHFEFRYIQTLNSETRSPALKTVIILGAGRGGTSAVSGLLRELGIAMPHAHPLKHEWSPVCYHDNGALDFESTALNFDRMNNIHEVWGWKSPKDLFIFDGIQSCVRNPTFVIIYRNFLDTCLSGARYGDYHWEICVEDYSLVQTQLSKLIMYSPHPIAALSYETLLRNPSPVIAELNNWLQLGADDEMILNAHNFVSSSVGYQAVSTDPHSGTFDPKELTRDRADIQAGLYTKAIEQLEQAIAALNLDIHNAQLVLMDLVASVHEMLEKHGSSLLPSGNNKIPTAFFSLSESDFKNALFADKLIHGEDTQDNSARPHNIIHEASPQPGKLVVINDSYLCALKQAYIETRKNYTDIIRRRILFQKHMENVASKRTLIKQLIDSADRRAPPYLTPATN